MDATIRSRSLIISVLIHAVIFLILLFTMLKTQVPPFPEGGGGGVLVNIGTVDEASGEIQPMSDVVTTQPVPEQITSAQEEEFATQDNEEAPVVKEKKDDKVKEVKKAVVETKAKPVERKADARSLYQGKTTASTSQGTGKGSGDQGDPSGDPNSMYKGKGGSGTGTGTGNGEGEGSGTGKGNGFDFSLAGRSMVRRPNISDRSQETGKVVVDITVDKNGEVVSAIPGGRGSTTTSSYLYRLAKDAAMKAKFNASPDDADIQRGTITFVFVVQ